MPTEEGDVSDDGVALAEGEAAKVEGALAGEETTMEVSDRGKGGAST